MVLIQGQSSAGRSPPLLRLDGVEVDNPLRVAGPIFEFLGFAACMAGCTIDVLPTKCEQLEWEKRSRIWVLCVDVLLLMGLERPCIVPKHR